LGELLRSPGEQQTEIVRRHFPELLFYRLDPDLKQLDPTLTKEIEFDDPNSVERLHALGERFAAQIDWAAMLEGRDTPYRVSTRNTLWYQYSRAIRPHPASAR
jgi:hypothetical protein